MAWPSARRWVMHRAARPALRAPESAGSRMLSSSEMMATTTSNSISVKPADLRVALFGYVIWAALQKAILPALGTLERDSRARHAAFGRNNRAAVRAFRRLIELN